MKPIAVNPTSTVKAPRTRAVLIAPREIAPTATARTAVAEIVAVAAAPAAVVVVAVADAVVATAAAVAAIVAAAAQAADATNLRPQNRNSAERLRTRPQPMVVAFSIFPPKFLHPHKFVIPSVAKNLLSAGMGTTPASPAKKPTLAGGLRVVTYN